VCALLKNSNKGNSASVKKAESTWFARKEQRGRGTEAHFFFFFACPFGTSSHREAMNSNNKMAV
jgi:hypothetical protein